MPSQQFVEFATDQWLPALRSGEYRQVTQRLRGPRDSTILGYCCLGVACNLYDPTKWGGNNYYEDTDLVLPDSLAELWDLTDTAHLTVNENFWAAIDRQPYAGHIYRIDLAGLNDTYDMSLAAIADVIAMALDPDNPNVSFQDHSERD